jgi:YVTN family beta-propeller protein
VTNNGSNKVSVIDTGTNSVVASITVENNPDGIAINPAGTRVYVANRGSDSVSVIDTGTNQVMDTMKIGWLPYGVAVNPSGTRIYVTSERTSGKPSFTVINVSNDANQVVDTVEVGLVPAGIVVNPAGTLIYVGDYVDNKISVVDANTNRVISTVQVGYNSSVEMYSPSYVAINLSGTRVYATSFIDKDVVVIDTNTNKEITGIFNSNDGYTYGYTSGIAIGTVPSEPAKCENPAKHAKYSIATGRVSIPFTDLPALKEDSPEATGGMAVFKNLRLQFFKEQDFKVVASTVTPDTSKEPVGDPCHAVYTYATRTLRIPRVEVPSIISTFPAITEGKPISIYEVTLQHIETNPVDLGIVRIKDATLIETIQ